MGYRIEYNVMAVKGERRHRVINQWVLGFVCVLGLLTGLYVCGFGDRMKELLLPGDAVVTQAAFSDMVEKIQQGENAVTALTEFCREILEHGPIA